MIDPGRAPQQRAAGIETTKQEGHVQAALDQHHRIAHGHAADVHVRSGVWRTAAYEAHHVVVSFDRQADHLVRRRGRRAARPRDEHDPRRLVASRRFGPEGHGGTSLAPPHDETSRAEILSQTLHGLHEPVRRIDAGRSPIKAPRHCVNERNGRHNDHRGDCQRSQNLDQGEAAAPRSRIGTAG